MLAADVPDIERELTEASDEQALYDAVHRLHGTAAICSLTELGTLACQVEDLLRRGEAEEARSRLPELLAQLRATRKAIGDSRADLASVS